MRTITKRSLKLDSLGNILAETLEELLDDEQGNISETTTATFNACEACARPIEDLKEIRGCDRCGRACCERCAVPCAVCSRRLCAQCRQGFAEKQLAVCQECLLALSERLGYHDRQTEEKIEFERRVTVLQEQIRFLQSPVFRTCPGGDLLADVAELWLMGKLSKLERVIAGRERRK